MLDVSGSRCTLSQYPSNCCRCRLFPKPRSFVNFSPIGRMPALILTSGEVLIESAAILDYLDEIAGAEPGEVRT